MTLVETNPLNCCENSFTQLSRYAALSKRGNCTFTTKAKISQAGGAVALIVMNDKEDLFKMVCSENDTFFDLKILFVMIPKSAGERPHDRLSTSRKVDLLLYSPE